MILLHFVIFIRWRRIRIMPKECYGPVERMEKQLCSQSTRKVSEAVSQEVVKMNFEEHTESS